MRLAGRLATADGEQLTFAGDLQVSLERSGRFFDERFGALSGVASGPTDPADWAPTPAASLSLRRFSCHTSGTLDIPARAKQLDTLFVWTRLRTASKVCVNLAPWRQESAPVVLRVDAKGAR